ncbi:hypothetical protein BKA70DRAFT_1350188 [Coprinopsis sp. MPI-PUGE-AT-0042]|nr:hypothetical protein BKA70DRAFT_1350188 [Coprinopsis sp. MPI-PUGE-AT-0042]
MRIVMESAAIYSTRMLICLSSIGLIIPRDGWFCTFYAPSTGIALVLLVVRARSASEEAKNTLASPSVLPMHSSVRVGTTLSRCRVHDMTKMRSI